MSSFEYQNTKKIDIYLEMSTSLFVLVFFFKGH